jgi:hypothetical protein
MHPERAIIDIRFDTLMMGYRGRSLKSKGKIFKED